MSAIVPAILAASRSDLESKLAKIRGIVRDVQIDVIDGRFASPACWPYSEGTREFAQMAANEDMLPGWGEISIEIDLMTADPEESAGQWIALGASRLTLHAESTSLISRVLDELKHTYGHDKDFKTDLLSLGFAIGMETDIALIDPFLERIDYVQFMGIRTIGRQREPFDDSVIRRIKSFRKKYPDIPVQVDGGVTKAVAPLLLEAGVSRLIVGHDLFDAPDFAAEYHALTALAEQYGRYE